MLSIRTMETDTAAHYHQVDNRYQAYESVRVCCDDTVFSLSYSPLPAPIHRSYPPDTIYTPQELLRRKDAVCFFAWMDDQLAGQAVVMHNWNELALLWDIRVDEAHRRKGVGGALLNACTQWAKKQGLKGIVAETQAQNPSACRFYERSGFVLGGADRYLYAAIQRKPEVSPDTALFFYLFF